MKNACGKSTIVLLGVLSVASVLLGSVLVRIGHADESHHNPDEMPGLSRQQPQQAKMAMDPAMLDEQVDSVDFEPLPKVLTFTDPANLQVHRMVLVPGDAAKGIDPLYVGVTEITWDQYRMWSHSEDISGSEWLELRELDLRPSRPSNHDARHGLGGGQKPAIAMTQFAAIRFADDLSQSTGLPLRLPTEAEWEHVFVTTQGPLDETPANVNDIAASYDNTDFETFEVGSLKANAYGIHDLLGNVGEWVTDSPDGEMVVRGGGYWLPAEGMNGALREVADMAIWNRSWPELPRSKWWVIDHVDHGFRLVCEVTPEVLKNVADQAGGDEGRP